MASAFSNISETEDDDTVMPKSEYKSASKQSHLITEDLRKKAFVPKFLPEDFLRVILNQKQVNENNDNALAQRLQYGLNTDPMEQYKYMRQQQQQQQQFRPRIANDLTFARGKLQIDIMEAKLTKNYGFTKMDPYVRLRLGTKVFETPTDYNGSKNPKWRKTVMCYLPFNVDMLHIEIFDEKSFMNDEMIAFVNYPLPDSLFNGIFLDEWIPLSGKLGEQKEGHINVQMMYTPINNSNNNFAQNALIKRVNTNKSTDETTSSSASSGNVSPPSSNSNIVQPRQVQLPPERSYSSNDTLNVSLADIAYIKEMFPTFDTEIVTSILESKNGNREATIETLLQMVAAD
jgi:toll-interacting protein